MYQSFKEIIFEGKDCLNRTRTKKFITATKPPAL